MTPPWRAWPVFLAYASAFAAVIVFSVAAGLLTRSAYPDLPQEAVLFGLPGLLAGGLASSSALALTVLVAARPLSAARLQLVPGRETGRALGVMIVGILALGQALDSSIVLAGLADRGSMPVIRRALAGARGPDLFDAVIVIGVLASGAEEVFFRGYMQGRLREVWSPWLTVVATSACFGIMHLEWIHGASAFLIGLYLGFVTERAGSALPAVACHIVNNVVFTVLTAVIGSVDGIGSNALMLGAAAVVFGGCVVWLWRALGPGAGPPAA